MPAGQKTTIRLFSDEIETETGGLFFVITCNLYYTLVTWTTGVNIKYVPYLPVKP